MNQAAITQKRIFREYTALLYRVLCAVLLLICLKDEGFAQGRDSAAILKTVHVNAVKNSNNFTSPVPVQFLNHEALQQINAPSVGDAARYFSGVLVKDYGGIGGLKTVSVRSLGASSTGIVYDGIPVSDLQTGQIDLSRFSTTFISSLELQQANSLQAALPARTYAPAASLNISTNTYNTTGLHQQNWQAGIRAGSFNLWQPFAGISIPFKKNIVVSINAEAMYSKGNYPFNIDNGNFSSKATRTNSDIRSIQGEANLLKQFNDSSTLQVKAATYNAERGLPGVIVFFNQRSVQRLRNTDFFTQARYHKKIKATTILASAKYSRTYTMYTDPDFLNNQGGLDDRYTQQETYGSIAVGHQIGKGLLLSAASDIAFNLLASVKEKSPLPNRARTSLWESVAAQYNRNRWQFNGALLYTGINGNAKAGTAAGNKNKFTPFIALSFVPANESPLLLRMFYKGSYRMPTFNDLYYNFIAGLADSSTLKPEYAQQYNAGITYSKQLNTTVVNRFSMSIDAYYNQVKDKIIAVPSQNLFVWTVLNLGKVSIKGIDINTEARGKIAASISWSARIAYTWQQAQDITNKTSSLYKNRIPYTPDHSGSGLLSFHYRQWETGYDALFSGTRFTLGENNPSSEMDGWMTHDVFVARSVVFSRFRMHVKAELNNLTDERFDVVHYYPMPGRSFKISLLFNNL